jgi:enoyl-CoA hydratase/carnithine racemase
MSQTFTAPPPTVPDTVISIPKPHVLLVTLNRPKQLNALRREMHYLLDRLWTWYDNEPSLRCAILTGTGRAFCAGADLKEWHDKHKEEGGASDPPQSADDMEKWNDNGFGGMSNRRGKKPIIAAVNGLCFGGGMEMVINADMVLASETAQFGLPEVMRGVVALAGALPRLIRLVGRARASEMALTGRTFTPHTMLEWGVINRVLPRSVDVVDEAVRWAAEVASNSPDSVIVSREGLLGGWEAEDPKASTNRIEKGIYADIDSGDNMKEGVLSFVEKRKPVWKDSKL